MPFSAASSGVDGHEEVDVVIAELPKGLVRRREVRAREPLFRQVKPTSAGAHRRTTFGCWRQVTTLQQPRPARGRHLAPFDAVATNSAGQAPVGYGWVRRRRAGPRPAPRRYAADLRPGMSIVAGVVRQYALRRSHDGTVAASSPVSVGDPRRRLCNPGLDVRPLDPPPWCGHRSRATAIGSRF